MEVRKNIVRKLQPLSPFTEQTQTEQLHSTSNIILTFSPLTVIPLLSIYSAISWEGRTSYNYRHSEHNIVRVAGLLGSAADTGGGMKVEAFCDSVCIS